MTTKAQADKVRELLEQGWSRLSPPRGPGGAPVLGGPQRLLSPEDELHLVHNDGSVQPITEGPQGPPATEGQA